MLALVAECARHAAAAGVKVHYLGARYPPQQFQKRRQADQRALMAMPLHKDSLRAGAKGDGYGIELFLECPTHAGDDLGVASWFSAQQGRIIVLDGEDAAGFTGHDGVAS